MNSPTQADRELVALCIWREARGEGTPGMAGVANVIANRCRRNQKTPTQVVMQKWAFSSMTDPNDPQLHNNPKPGDQKYAVCLGLSLQVFLHLIQDTTEGATLYYDDSISFPASWDRSKVVATVKIGRLNFFREL